LIFEDDLKARNQVHCDYIMGLGYLGLNKTEEANACFEKVLSSSNMHVGAKTHKEFMSSQSAVGSRQ
jgi:hypothetical protein